MMKVLIADDERLSLEGVSRIVNELEGFSVSGKATNGLEAYELIKKLEPDILITDIKMPQKDGIWLIQQIDEQSLPVTVIVISAYDDQIYIKTAIRSNNVNDYLFKPFMREELENALNVAASFHRKRFQAFDNRDISFTRMVNAITANDYSLIEEDINEYFSHTVENLHDIKNRIYGWLMYIHYSVFPANRSVPFNSRQTMREVYECSSIEEVKSVVSEYLKNCCRKYYRNEEVTVLVNACLQLMNKELANPDLNLNYCARTLDVTPNYLSSRFSRDMHQNFSTYLNEMRLTRGRELLGNVNLKVYEVSNQIGFSDVGYFNRVFKEKYGETPLQYRQNVMAGREDE